MSKDARPPTRAEKQERTREALVDAAGRVFVSHGFLGSSVERIAAEAGFTRGAFYAHFATKEELFAEVLQQRVYARYRRLIERTEEPASLTLEQVGEQLAAMQDEPEGRWLFRLWLELLAHAGRDDRFREVAAGFWRANRQLTAHALQQRLDAAGQPPGVAPDRMASAMIALDIGLALQHHVDPEAVPLDVYPELFAALFGPHDPLGPGG